MNVDRQRVLERPILRHRHAPAHELRNLISADRFAQHIEGSVVFLCSVYRRDEPRAAMSASTYPSSRATVSDSHKVRVSAVRRQGENRGEALKGPGDPDEISRFHCVDERCASVSASLPSIARDEICCEIDGDKMSSQRAKPSSRSVVSDVIASSTARSTSPTSNSISARLPGTVCCAALRADHLPDSERRPRARESQKDYRPQSGPGRCLLTRVRVDAAVRHEKHRQRTLAARREPQCNVPEFFARAYVFALLARIIGIIGRCGDETRRKRAR
jgi:hypothetical protein